MAKPKAKAKYDWRCRDCNHGGETNDVVTWLRQAREHACGDHGDLLASGFVIKSQISSKTSLQVWLVTGRPEPARRRSSS